MKKSLLALKNVMCFNLHMLEEEDLLIGGEAPTGSVSQWVRCGQATTNKPLYLSLNLSQVK